VDSSIKRNIVRVGIALLVIVAVSYFAVALIATLEGSGGFSIAHSFSGRQSFFSPIAAIPLLVAIVGIAIYWLWRKIGNLPKGESEPNPALKRTRRKAARLLVFTLSLRC
jgi:hypothetical protein